MVQLFTNFGAFTIVFRLSITTVNPRLWERMMPFVITVIVHL